MEIIKAVSALSALAQESRLEVFRLLVKATPEGIPAGHIAEALDIPPATLSFHLKELTNAGLAQSAKQGRSVSYSIHIEGINELMAFLTEDCCQGRPELCEPVCCTAKPPKQRRNK